METCSDHITEIVFAFETTTRKGVFILFIYCFFWQEDTNAEEWGISVLLVERFLPENW